jgi:hypothetical protein
MMLIIERKLKNEIKVLSITKLELNLQIIEARRGRMTKQKAEKIYQLANLHFFHKE